jgi:DNA-binding NarL/FixJ family response regulator
MDSSEAKHSGSDRAREPRLRVVSIPLEPTRWPRELTDAEQDVARGLVRGETYAAIAARRATSPHTVAAQVRQMLRKLALSSTAELVASLARRERTE